MRNRIMAVIVPVLFILNPLGTSRAQEGERYFPLHVGDTRTYTFDVDPDPDPSYTETVSDTTVIDGKTYHILTQELGFADTVREDRAGRILRYNGDHEYLWFDFTADSGAVYLCEFPYFSGLPEVEPPYRVEVRRPVTRETPMGVFGNCVEFIFNVPEVVDEEMVYVFAPGAGRVVIGSYAWSWYEMTRAVIGGRVYETTADFDVRTETEQDSLALAALFDATGGAGWTQKDNWLSGPLNTWFGVTVSGGRVVNLDLRDNNLTGTLPNAIGDLTGLTDLNLRDNVLMGAVPARFWTLTSLVNVRLSGNRLTGEIPPEIGNLTRLSWLTLYGNQLTGPIPPEIGRLTALTHLYLRNNRFDGPIPAELGHCALLKELFLEANGLTGTIPPELGNLTSCYRLSIANNQLTGSIPPELGGCVSMEVLDLSENRLEGVIPSEFGNFRELYDLNLDGNELTGEIPSSLFLLPHLRTLRLDGNLLEGPIPETIGDCTTLERLDLRSNLLSGPVPDGLAHSDSLRHLFLMDNGFTSLPDLSSLKALQMTHVYDNRLTFEDIEPNIGIQQFVYWPQDSVGEEADTTVLEGCSLILSVEVGGTANLYKWFRDGAEISGATGSTHEIPAAGAADAGDYVCRITSTLVPNLTLFSRPIHVTVEPDVGIDASRPDAPAAFALHQNFPNPFNPVTAIRYDVKEPCRVRLTVCDLSGRVVAEPVDAFQPAGGYEARFDGAGLASGVYLCRIWMKNFTAVRKMALMR